MALPARTLRILGLWTAAAFGCRAAPVELPLEYPIKAAFLYNLVKFVEWPAQPNAPITVCVLGKGSLEATLQQVVEGKQMDGRPLLVRHIGKTAEVKGCQVAFIADSEVERLPDILLALKDSRVLTVSDIDGFANQGGMIYLLVDNKKVHFEVNTDSLSRARVKISARFLQLATVVRDRDRGKR